VSVEAYDLVDGTGAECGAVLICNTTGLPLPLSHGRFANCEEGEAYLQWLGQNVGIDARRLNAEELERLHGQWVAAGKPGIVCPECGYAECGCGQ
jgi:hypothetical protein